MTQAVRSGITFAERIPGIVTEYEEREAARFGLYRWIDWCALPRSERLMGLAHYRTSQLIELHEGEALSDHMKVQQARQQAGQRVGPNQFLGGRPRGGPIGAR